MTEFENFVEIIRRAMGIGDLRASETGGGGRSPRSKPSEGSTAPPSWRFAETWPLWLALVVDVVGIGVIFWQRGSYL